METPVKESGRGLLARCGRGAGRNLLRYSLAFFVIKGLVWSVLLLAPLLYSWL